MARSSTLPLSRTKPLSLPVQDLHVKSRFPGFRNTGNWKCANWVGDLRPQHVSPVYTVKIRYRLGSTPKVWVQRPTVDERSPHLYRDGSLCLFYPKDASWHSGMKIADMIIPWISDWLLYYELWQDTGKWLGPEAPHQGPKRTT